MSEIVPSDARFEVDFAEARVSQVYLARYYLRALERRKKGEEEPEWIPNDEEEFINLEHILPENPESNWPGIDPDTASANYRRIGNMVIMQAKKNLMIGNSSFADKKPHLKDSAFLLTSEIAQYTDWGVSEIKARQKELAKLAIETWPIKI